MNLPQFSVKRSVTVLMLILIIAIFGMISFTRLGVELMPDITFPTVSIITKDTGVAPEDIETMITKPIEGVVSTVKNVKKVSSISKEGISVVMVELEWGSNIDFITQDIREAIDIVKDYLPEDASKPMIVKTDPSMMPIIELSVTGNKDPIELRNIAKDIKDRLEQVRGIANVTLMGGAEREIQVKVDRERMKFYNISLNQIIQILAFENLNLPGGNIQEGYNDFLVRTLGEFGGVDEIGNIVIGARDNIPIHLKDVALIKDEMKDMRSFGRTNKRRSVILLCSKSSGVNTVRAANNLKSEVERLEGILPEDIEIGNVFDQGKTTTDVVSSTVNSALWGSLLAILSLLLFFRNWRPTLVIAFSIPLSILATFIAMHIAGFTFNIMTIGGFALGVGMLLSNAIIVIENIFRHLEEGEGREKASISGTTEVLKAILGSTLTTVVVFLPLIYASGIAGQLSRGLALTIAFSLLASLLVAFTIVPMLASRIFVKRKKKKEYEAHFGERFFEGFNRGYKSVLTYTLEHRKRIGLITLVVFVVSLFLLLFVGKEFIPGMDSSMFSVNIAMPVGTSLDETEQVMKQLEDIVLSQPEVKLVSSFGGESEMGQASFFMGGTESVNEGQLMVRLKDKRRRSEVEIKDAIRKKIPHIEGAKIEFPDMSQSIMGSGEAPIEIKIFGPDLSVLDTLSAKIVKAIENTNGIKDIDRSLGKGKPEIVIRVDRQAASRVGLTAGQIATQVEVALKGKVATKYKEKGEEYDLRVQLRATDRKTRSDIGNIGILTSLGTTISVKNVAKIIESKGSVKLLRENQKRKVTVSAAFMGRDLGSIMADIKQQVSGISKADDYFIDYGGEAESMQETFKSLGITLLLAILVVYMIMAAVFESLTHPFVVMFTLPFAAVGVILILLITNISLSLTSLLGVIILVGVIVNAGIVLVDYINQLRKGGMKRDEAIIQGGMIKLRTVILINLTTVLGLLPMALTRARMGAIMAPMATSVVGGLVVGTILTLIVVPLVYSIFDDVVQKLASRLKR